MGEEGLRGGQAAARGVEAMMARKGIMSRSCACQTNIVPLLDSCRKALETWRGGSTSEAGRECLFGELDRALESAVAYIRAPKDPSALASVEAAMSALAELSAASGKVGAEVSRRPEVATPDDDMHALSRSFHEALGLVAMADADQPGGLDQAIDRIRALVKHPSAYASFRASLSVAVERLTKVVRGQSPDASSDLAEASRLLDTAAVQLEQRLIGSGGNAGQEPRSTEPPPPPPTDQAAVDPLPLDQHAVASVPSYVAPDDLLPEGPQVPVGSAPGRPATESTFELPQDADPGLLSEFLTECHEYIEGAEAALLTLEGNPEDAEAINTVFRAFHTIKGTSGFLGLRPLTELAHKAENLLSRARDKQIRCTGGYADLALRSTDTLKLLVEQVHAAINGSAPRLPEDYDELIRVLGDPEAAGVSDDPNDAMLTVPRIGDLVVALTGAPRDQVESAAGAAQGAPIGEALVKSQVASLIDVSQALRMQKKIARRSDEGSDSSVRIRTDRLDRLIDMVGELVIAQSMVAQDAVLAGGGRPDLQRKVTHTGKIVRELQDLSMSMRMVPLKPTFQKMARLVRDLAHKSGKQVEFRSHGEDTEIDRNMVDVLADPLVHMMRNAVDHGIEFPTDRERAGKPGSGTVELSAYNEGGNIVVQLKDDGRGLNRDKIVAKAVARGLIESDKGMTDGDVYNLIFEAGFSTAEQVTEVSGRGVGMDVVRRSIQSLHGRIEIQSEMGRGTVFTVKLPLTLAVTDGMLIRVGSQKFVLPTISIHMSFRPDQKSISTIGGRAEMVMLRGSLVPVVRLHRLFGITDGLEDPLQALLVVIEDGERRAALMVDELLGQQQVVAKSVGEASGKVLGIAGGAILGDGRVGLILDPTGVIALARGGALAPEASMTIEHQLA